PPGLPATRPASAGGEATFVSPESDALLNRESAIGKGEAWSPACQARSLRLVRSYCAGLLTGLISTLAKRKMRTLPVVTANPVIALSVYRVYRTVRMGQVFGVAKASGSVVCSGTSPRG